MLYVPFPAIPCINDEDKSVADAMGFSYDDVVDENYIVKSGQVSFIKHHFWLFFGQRFMIKERHFGFSFLHH